jgi:hypothetical protein
MCAACEAATRPRHGARCAKPINELETALGRVADRIGVMSSLERSYSPGPFRLRAGDRRGAPNCPKCRKPMRLAYSLPKTANRSELHSFGCRPCRKMVTQAVPNTAP